MEKLENIIESILFVSGDEIPVSDLCLKFGVDRDEVDVAVKKLKRKYSGECGIRLLTFNGKLQFSSNPDYVDFITEILNPIRQRNLTKATLETAAIIAYKQPVTRAEIEETRGVNSDYAINVLLDHKLIELCGHKDTVGKPALFGTTDEFLKRFGIDSLKELPDYDTVVENIHKMREAYTDELFNRFEPVLNDNPENSENANADTEGENESLDTIDKLDELDRKLAEISGSDDGNMLDNGENDVL